MDKFVVNIIHRPEMVPEYAEKVTGHGKAEDIGRKALLTESLDIFKTQQECAHKNGLKTTIQMTYASLFNDEAVALAKEHHEKYGDEIALTLLGLPCTEFREKYKTKDFCIWMFSMEDKKSIVDDVFGKFYERFGFYPESTGSYYMDADLTNYIKSKYPMVKCAVATCWEEGPKAYHTCNNSWYTFMDGGPWAPWIPSKQNTHAPAANEAEDSGIVAIPHLSRDLINEMLSAGISMGLMLSVFAIGSIILQKGINQLGKEIITAHTASRRIYEMLMMPLSTIATANSTFVGQNFGTIKNLKLGVAITVSSSSNVYAGAFCGENRGTIENCSAFGVRNSPSFSFYATAESFAGGITGVNYGTVKNCGKGLDMSGTSNMGGIVGLNYGNIDGCTNNQEKKEITKQFDFHSLRKTQQNPLR